MKILLAIDGSTFSDAAVGDVAAKPWPAGSEVRMISVVEPPLLPTVETWVPPDDYIESLERAGEDQANSVIKTAVDRIQKLKATAFECPPRSSGDIRNTRSSTQRKPGTPI